MVKLRCKVAICGDSTVGKTAILKMFLERNFPNQYLMTMNAQVFNKVIPVPSSLAAFTAPPFPTPMAPREVHSDDEYNPEELSALQQQMLGQTGPSVQLSSNQQMDEVELYIFDISGSKLYENSVQGFLQDLNAFVIVYDVSNEQSFLNAQKWYEKCTKTRPSTNDKNKHSPSLIGILIGNKTDQTQFQKVSMVQGEALAKNLNLQFFHMSAMSDSGAVEEPFHYIANQFHVMYNEKIELISYMLEHNSY